MLMDFIGINESGLFEDLGSKDTKRKGKKDKQASPREQELQSWKWGMTSRMARREWGESSFGQMSNMCVSRHEENPTRKWHSVLPPPTYSSHSFPRWKISMANILPMGKRYIPPQKKRKSTELLLLFPFCVPFLFAGFFSPPTAAVPTRRMRIACGKRVRVQKKDAGAEQGTPTKHNGYFHHVFS